MSSFFIGDYDPHKPMSKKTVNSALRVMTCETKVDVYSHGFRTMACSSMIEAWLWSKDAEKFQMSRMERSTVRATYSHKVELIYEHKLVLEWWPDILDANREKGFTPFDYAKINWGKNMCVVHECTF